MIEKVRPFAEIVECCDSDGRHSWEEIEYRCPTCKRIINHHVNDVACDKCGTFYDWSKTAKIRTVESIVWS